MKHMNFSSPPSCPGAAADASSCTAAASNLEIRLGGQRGVVGGNLDCSESRQTSSRGKKKVHLFCLTKCCDSSCIVYVLCQTAECQSRGPTYRHNISRAHDKCGICLGLLGSYREWLSGAGGPLGWGHCDNSEGHAMTSSDAYDRAPGTPGRHRSAEAFR